MPDNFADLATSLPFIKSRLFALSTYVNSHDNLIMDIYKKELVILPIRVGTIDFNKMTKQGPNNTTLLSDVAQDAVEQAEYVTEEKLQNESSQNKHLFIKIEKKN